ncbi:alcohol dehydrogenase [acceptor]-like [Amphiura filiformis]|uniref:alcohol dehydrogenase [acceptor]-like n=1 Tax=Amphiura filiformis TaxID=82378 RepID=UPI003B2129BB
MADFMCDFAVVGAGSAGCVVAGRLSENFDNEVILFEAGPSNAEFPSISVPSEEASLRKTQMDWQYEVIGGCCAHNSMVWSRGHAADFDSWERLGANGWGWEGVLPYFLKLENWKCDIYCDSPLHNEGGPITITNHPECRTEASKLFVKSGTELGYNIIDINGGQNIDIVNKRAVGIRFIQDGKEKTCRVRKEVIVSGGTIQSPQLLMLSGIGPRAHLENHGITCIADLPVGQNLQDHIGVQLKADVEKRDSVHTLETTFASCNNGNEAAAFVKTGHEPETSWPDIHIGAVSNFYTFGIDEPDGFPLNSKKFYPNMGYDMDREGRYRRAGMSFIPIVLHPRSVGEITLASSDPMQPPLIDPRYLEDPLDVEVLVEGIRIAKRCTETISMKTIGTKLLTLKMPDSHKAEFSDENLEDFVRHFAFTLFHPVGTCKMGKMEDPTTVVDPQLRVHGISGLRVVDASIMPHLTSGNTNAPCIMIGEKGADIIRNT